MSDPKQYVEELARTARRASRQLAQLRGERKVAALKRMAGALRQQQSQLIEANAADISAAREAGLAAAPLVERLKLNEKRVESMAVAVEQIAAQVDPIGQVIEGYVRPNGLRIQKVRVPIGVVLFIYESRPNVTSDAAALCLKSGNAIILRGGKEAFHSNRTIAKIISDALAAEQIDPAAVQLIESTDRALLPPLLKLDGLIDVVIPGGEGLIRTVVQESTIPVLKHFTGNCHVYVDRDIAGMEQQVRSVCVNAKTGYPGGAVCNAAEKILVHADVAPRILPAICDDLAVKGVQIVGDARTRRLWPKAGEASEEDWHTEYLALKIAVKVVDSLEQAIEHINHYGSHHTDAILTASMSAAETFVTAVDSGSVMVNASTRFSDGGEYGLGAEVGISTDKLHARGPMGAADLTTYKWIVRGDGHVRQPCP